MIDLTEERIIDIVAKCNERVSKKYDQNFLNGFTPQIGTIHFASFSFDSRNEVSWKMIKHFEKLLRRETKNNKIKVVMLNRTGIIKWNDEK